MSMKLTPCPMAKSKSAHTSSGVLWMKPSQPSATALTRRPVLPKILYSMIVLDFPFRRVPDSGTFRSRCKDSPKTGFPK